MIPAKCPDEYEVLPSGAKQSKLNTRYDLLPARAIERLAEVLDYGAIKYGDNNWRGIPVDSHINHALRHLFLFMADDASEDHLGHAFCRVAMALETVHNPLHWG